MNKRIPCPDCNGRGYHSRNNIELIPKKDVLGIPTMVETGRSWVEPCMTCEGRGYVEVPMTNGDMIRTAASTDESIAEIMSHIISEYPDAGEPMSKLFCDGSAGCIDSDGNIHCDDEKIKACILRWLQSPAKEGRRELKTQTEQEKEESEK